MEPLIKATMVPPNIALNPSIAKSLFFLGEIEPIPPICIAIEEKLANPVNANVVMIIERSEIKFETLLKWVKATNSFITSFSPSKLPTA